MVGRKRDGPSQMMPSLLFHQLFSSSQVPKETQYCDRQDNDAYNTRLIIGTQKNVSILLMCWIPQNF